MYISIITINRNNSHGLRKTIESVILQSFTNYELIVIDGASKDNSAELLRIYADKITFGVSEPDKGIYNAMNKGIVHAKGEYCLFLNSGDVFYNENSLMSFVNGNFNQDIIIGRLVIQRPNNLSLKEVFEIPDNLNANFLFNNYIPHPCTFIKRELLIKLGYYNEELKIVSDWEFFLKALLIEKVSWAKIDECISIFTVDGLSSMPENSQLIVEEKERVLSNLFPLFVEDYKTLNSFTQKDIEFKSSLQKKVIDFLYSIQLIPLLVFISKLFLKVKKIFV